MKFWILIALPFFFIHSKAEDYFCKYRKNSEFFPQALTEFKNKIQFDNPSGKLGIGLCWWHTRLQRNLIYLAHFAPYLKKPSLPEFRDLVERIIRGDEVVFFPGFSSISDLTSQYPQNLAYQKIMIDELSQWQLRDAFIQQRWAQSLVRPLALLTSAERAEKTWQNSIRIAQLLKAEKMPIPVMLREKGAFHMGLFYAQTKHVNPDRCLSFKMIESNSPTAMTVYTVCRGEELARYGTGDKAIPYPLFVNESRQVREVMQNYCQ